LDSNVIQESELQFEKHHSLKNSTDAGRMISIKPVSRNAHRGICANLESVSSVTEKSDLLSEKQFAPKNTTELGTRTNLTPVLANPRDSIRSNFDMFSITSELIHASFEIRSDEINMIGAGSHSLLSNK
jgi:hypothetical protein